MRWDFLISTQQNLFVIFGAPKELCSNGERKNDGALISIDRNPLAKSLLTIGILERAKRNWNAEGYWNARRLLERPKATGTPEGLLEHRAAPYPYSKMCELCELCELFVKKSHRFCDGIFLFFRSRIAFGILRSPF